MALKKWVGMTLAPVGVERNTKNVMGIYKRAAKSSLLILSFNFTE